MLATLGALVMLIRPSLRKTYEFPVAAFVVLSAIATQLALNSGQAREERLPKSDLIERHSQIAEQARPYIFIFAMLMVGVVIFDYLDRRSTQAADAAASSARADEGSASADRPN